MDSLSLWHRTRCKWCHQISHAKTSVVENALKDRVQEGVIQRLNKVLTGLRHCNIMLHLKVKQWSTLCLKNDNVVLCYNLNAHQPILIIFGRDIAE